MKQENIIITFSILLLTSIPVYANNNLYEKIIGSLDNAPLLSCNKNSTVIIDSSGNEISKFKLPHNKINITLRNNKRLYLYNAGIVKKYSFETASNPGYPYIIVCPI